MPSRVQKHKVKAYKINFLNSVPLCLCAFVPQTNDFSR